ncbi:ScbA/BarX family gamma-butyrolactone biosynthesis protein [Streptomyces sp. NPDC006335]|uniref:ScbA/BarX family gamma-butyrolactone biosynthesis protein n=1 Tax=Streptomyces sp. NPDC006335 TaxID=3156895 RepID=UPI0033B97482
MASKIRDVHTGAHRAVFPEITAGELPKLPVLPVNRTLVHRANLHDVLPTELTRHDDTHFTVSTRWPRDHRLFVTPDGRYTASLVLETIRQATLLVSHAELGVPLGHHFVMWELCHRLDAELLTCDATAEGITLDVDVTELRRRGAVPAGVAMEMTIRMGGRTVGSGSIRFNITSPAAYERIRGALRTSDDPAFAAALPEPVDPPTVHHVQECDVVLADTDTPGRWQLRADPANRLFFDRINDHIPAMVLVEAAQQAANLLVPWSRFAPSSSEMNFSRYVEFDAPCWIEAHPFTAEDGTTSVSVTGHQDGQLAFVIRFVRSAAR